MTGLAVTAGASTGELVIGWDAYPEALENYRVSWTPEGESFKGYNNADFNAFVTTTSHTVEGLVPGATYDVRVRARIDPAQKLRSEWSDVVAGDAAAAPPLTGVTATAGASTGELVIGWDAYPEALENYRVSWTPEGESFKGYNNADFNAFVTTTSHTVEGLVPGATYDVRVRARIDPAQKLRSEWSDVVTGDARR